MTTFNALTHEDVMTRLAEIEDTVHGIRKAYESEDNHGDSCWHGLVDWHPLADEYAELRWLGGAR